MYRGRGWSERPFGKRLLGRRDRRPAWHARMYRETRIDETRRPFARRNSNAARLFRTPKKDCAMNHDHSRREPSQGPNWSGINQWLLWLGLAAAVGWLVVRHSAHLFEILPFLIILACPLMHLFGHGGHGGHAGHGSTPAERPRGDGSDPRGSPPTVPPSPSGHSH